MRRIQTNRQMKVQRNPLDGFVSSSFMTYYNNSYPLNNMEFKAITQLTTRIHNSERYRPQVTQYITEFSQKPIDDR